MTHSFPTRRSSDLSKTALFDSATWATELTWNDYVKVRSGKNLFYADGYAACTGKDKWDGCATKNYVGLSAKFTAVWYQVFPNIDLQLTEIGRASCRERVCQYV